MKVARPLSKGRVTVLYRLMCAYNTAHKRLFQLKVRDVFYGSCALKENTYVLCC